MESSNKNLKYNLRIILVGDFLRKTALDKWLRFINVLIEEMSFIDLRCIYLE